jgi:hypothetical protein
VIWNNKTIPDSPAPPVDEKCTSKPLPPIPDGDHPLTLPIPSEIVYPPSDGFRLELEGLIGTGNVPDADCPADITGSAVEA